MTAHRSTYRCASTVALALGSLAAPAQAEGWSIFKLENVADAAACMTRARQTISSYVFDYGGNETAADSWSVYGFDLEPGQQDVMIVCLDGADGAIDALLVVQSESEREPREQVAEALVKIWDGE